MSVLTVERVVGLLVETCHPLVSRIGVVRCLSEILTMVEDYLDPNLASVEPHQEPVLGRRRNPPQQQMLFGEASTDLFDHNTSMANADDQGGLNKSLDANSAYNPDRRNPRRSPYLDDSPQQIQDRDTELARSLSARGNGDLTQEQLMMICRGSGEGVGRDLLGGSYGSTPIQSNTGENAVEQTHQPRPQPLSINGNQPPTTNEGLSIVAHMRFRRPRIEQEPFVELAEQARMYQEREHQAEESRENDGQTRSTLTNAHEDAPSDIREELMSRVYSLPSELRIMIFEQLLPVRADVTVTYRHGNFYYSVRGPFHSSSPQTLPRWRDIMALADAHDDRWRNEVNGVYRAFWTRNTFEFPNAGTLRRWTESIGRTQRSMITSVVLQISRTDPIWEIVLTLRLLGQSRVLQSLVIRFNIDSLTTTRQNNPSTIAWFREIERYRGLTHFELIPLDNDGRPSTLSNAADRLRRFVMRRRDAGAPAYREENALGRYPLVHTTIYNNYNATELIKWLTAQGTTSAQMSTNLHQLSIQVADRQQRLFDNPPSHDVPPLVPRPRRLARFSRRMQQTATQDDPQINAPSGVNQDASSHRLGDGSTSLSHTKKRKFEDEGDDDNDDDDDTEEEWDNKEEE